MATKIRLARRGRKRRPIYDIVVADSRSPRDGKFIEKLGTYNPNLFPKEIKLNEDSAFKWIMTGAQPTETARNLLSQTGIMLKKHLQVGVNKGAITQEEADKKYNEWKANKEKSNTSAVEKAVSDKEAARKAKFDAEAKKVAEQVKAQEEAAAAAAAEAAAAAKAEEEAATAAEAPAEEAPEAATEEAPAAEAEEAPAAEEKKEDAE